MSHVFMRAGLLVCLTASVAAGQIPERYLEVRPFAGASMPTGAHRDAFKAAPLVGGQAALWFAPTFDIVTSLGWQAAESKYDVSSKMADVWVYDVGLEKTWRNADAGSSQLAPFVGAGFGGRSYHFRSAALTGSTCFAAYGSAGARYELGPSAVRLALRDDAFCYTAPFARATSEARNEASIVFSLGYRF